MKIIYMGTPDFAVPALEKLNSDSEIDIEAVITQPDRKQGRGQKVKFSAVKEKALELGIKVMQNENVNKEKFLNKVKILDVDFIVVVAFGQKLSPALLEIPEYGCINLHASILPEYRGSSPIHKAIIDGKKITGNTTMYMAEGWDDGDIIYQQEIKIDRDDTVGLLHDKLAQSGANLLVKTLKDVKAGTAPRISQSDDKATFAYKIDKSLGEIDWSKSAEDIYNLIRGVNPWPGAYTYHQDKRIKIWESEIYDSKSTKADPGTIIASNNDEGILVQTAEGIISIKKLQLSGSRKMKVDDFLNGYDIDKSIKMGS